MVVFVLIIVTIDLKIYLVNLCDILRQILSLFNCAISEEDKY